MNVIAVLPARMGATRFPGKPLEKLHGIPMIGHCLMRTRMAQGLAGTFVATCDGEIADYVASAGGEAVMTANTHNRATDRTAEAVRIIENTTGMQIDAVIMIQGDEPLIVPDDIEAMLRQFEDATIDIVNLMARIPDEDAFRDPNNVKVVCDRKLNALYMSREAIPSDWKSVPAPRYMQIGAIGFRKRALADFNAAPETVLEQAESIDMCRVLENGGSIRMVLTDAVMLGVDTPAELAQAETMLSADPWFAEYRDA